MPAHSIASTVRTIDGFSKTKPSVLTVNIVYTSMDGTLLALRRAAELARGLEARIRILVPEVVPFPLPLNKPPVCTGVKTLPLQTAAARSTIHTHIATRIDVILCRDRLAGLTQALAELGSTVIMGGAERWWPTETRRLGKALSRSGHAVLFVSE